jgi:hypothetical protein
MSVLTDLATRLDDAGVATLDTNLFRGRFPNEPDECIALQTFGEPEPRIRNNEYLAADERFNVQVAVRSLYQRAAETLADSAWDAIQFRSETLTSGRYYPYARATSTPSFIGVDDRGRHVLRFDVQVRRLRSTGL